MPAQVGELDGDHGEGRTGVQPEPRAPFTSTLTGPRSLRALQVHLRREKRRVN